ncbi:hypothetical protein B0H14DRAFT_3691876 [Mycena olivaceomarginata]|nr:hypothetical protein B0H14DRAFT_3691876 [Mycena olivaceomarginata]
MPRRKLGKLSNLNTHSPNTLSKHVLKHGQDPQEEVETSKWAGKCRTGDYRKTTETSKNASSSDVSGHSTSSHKSLPRRVLSSIVNAVSPSRLSRTSSLTSDIPTDFPIASHASDTLDSSGITHHDPLADLPSPAGSIDTPEELLTDPRDIDVPEGEDDASHGYSEPLPDVDDPTNDPPLTRNGTPWEARQAPTQVMALEALDALKLLLFVPSDATKRKRTIPTKINGWSRKHLEEMSSFLSLYTGKESNTRGQWTASSIQAAVSLGKGKGGRNGHARMIRERARKYIFEREVPVNPFGTWAKSKLETHPGLADELKEHLVSIGKYVQARDIVDFLNRPTSKSNITSNHKGQHVDGHEREDVVRYRQEVFLPAWYSMEGRMRAWTGNNMETPEDIVELINEAGKWIVVWFHDESIFYAHDRRTSQWVADDASPSPYAKGEGVSLMVADFVSADYGWLRSKDGLESARVIFRPGKNRDGHCTNEEILAQLEKAMNILERDYPNDIHVFVFDNATTHLKRADDAISARNMPKKTPVDGKNWGIEASPF